MDPAEVHLDFFFDISISEGTLSIGLAGGVLAGEIASGSYFPAGTVGSST